MQNIHLDLSLIFLLLSAALGCITLFFWNVSHRYSDTYRSLKLRRRTRTLFLMARIASVMFLALGLYFLFSR